MSVRWDCCKISLQAPPLDYSFRGISFIQDLLTEEPRAGLKVIRRSAGGKLLTQAVRLNNNTINELTDFASTMEQLLEYPAELSWVDLSFNDLPTIDPAQAGEEEKPPLALWWGARERPWPDSPPHARPDRPLSHRSYVLSVLPQLKSFDFSGVTKQDRSTATFWRRMNVKPKKVKKRRDDY
ncbi:hypothetical protein KIL84_019522 [Mauremys mutica]|uniref:Uncharacterized protein n=1 Tax=Mauremys mutica TaxID=74926 RepID=A0A9D3XWR8_9SAUR|nr:hypothetical protein KIL84_019522 [Mauremys mutica]